jgi:succinylglutamic semialdehyde dehydrogenase
MGGNNPLIIGTISNLEAAAFLTIQSAFITSGQRCTCARRLIVPSGEKGDAFIEALKCQIQKIEIGAYTSRPEPYMGPLISSDAANKIMSEYHSLISLGGVPIIPLSKLPLGPAFLSPGLIDVTAISKRGDGEIFGPLLQLIRVNSLESAIAEANHTRYGLVAGLLSDREEEYHAFYSQIRAGVVNWNTPLTGASSAAPFGGVKQSGNHRPSAYYAADYCSYPVSSLENRTLQVSEGAISGMKR